MEDFNRYELEKLSNAVRGKFLSNVTHNPDSEMDDILIFEFADGTNLKIRYDWIYEWELT